MNEQERQDERREEFDTLLNNLVNGYKSMIATLEDKITKQDDDIEFLKAKNETMRIELDKYDSEKREEEVKKDIEHSDSYQSHVDDQLAGV